MGTTMTQTTADTAASVYFLTRDTDLTLQLKPYLVAQGLGLEVFPATAPLLLRMDRQSHGLLLIDAQAVPDPEAIASLQEQVERRRGASLPMAWLDRHGDVRRRLAALRAGARAHLRAPMHAEELAERLVELLPPGQVTPDRVLVVDDQPVAALFASRVLESAGMVSECVGDPLAVLDALEAFLPDLVVMDLHMPGASGIELTRIIREHDRFAGVPIVFLSAELDAEQQLATLRVGGDDFLAKPVAPERLVACVRQRLQRARERARREAGTERIDPVTGLVGRAELLRRLDRLIGQGGGAADRRALLYLDVAGDMQALLRVAEAVRERTEPPDLVARVGERALAILIRRTDKRVLGQVCDDLARDLAAALPQLEIGAGWCAFSDSGGDSVSLVSRARTAARSARNARPMRYRRTRRPDDGPEQGVIGAAIESGQLQLLFEPVVALLEMPEARYEVTPRLAIGNGELLPPGEFVPVARRLGLAEQLDRWLLGSGLDALKASRDAGRTVRLFLHQSCASVCREDWVAQVRAEINARDLFGLRPVLQLQIAEAERDLQTLAERVAQLARLGIRVCLNGLDTGVGGQQVLEAVPAAFVRLTRSVVQALDPEPLAALVKQAKERGLTVIAAGVDAPETIARLCRAGVDLLQGPFLQPPSACMAYDFGGDEDAHPR